MGPNDRNLDKQGAHLPKKIDVTPRRTRQAVRLEPHRALSLRNLKASRSPPWPASLRSGPTAALCALITTTGQSVSQNHRSRTQRPSLGRSLNVSSPSKWSILRSATASGGASRILTAMRRRPSLSTRSPRQQSTQPHFGQK